MIAVWQTSKRPFLKRLSKSQATVHQSSHWPMDFGQLYFSISIILIHFGVPATLNFPERTLDSHKKLTVCGQVQKIMEKGKRDDCVPERNKDNKV